jgi:hypothetical protein
LLHLLVRFLLRPAPRDPGDAYGGDANATTFQGQLQQLFHLHDAGVDQSFIDALPVFLYGAVVGAGGIRLRSVSLRVRGRRPPPPLRVRCSPLVFL